VQTYFKKIVSPLWQQKLEEQYAFDDETLRKKFRKMAHDEGMNGKLGLS
jgi:hypothetical protein